MSIAEDVEAIIAGYTDIEVDPGGANVAIVRYLGTDERLASERLFECVAPLEAAGFTVGPVGFGDPPDNPHLRVTKPS